MAFKGPFHPKLFYDSMLTVLWPLILVLTVFRDIVIVGLEESTMVTTVIFLIRQFL